MTPDQIKALRAASGLTQAGLAARLGVKLRTVQTWEYGTRTPSGPALMMLKRVAKAAKGKPNETA